MVPADSRRISRVPRYSGYRYAAFRFTYWTITVYGHIFQSVLFTICIQCRGPTTPATPCDATGLGCSPFARHYWGNHYLFSLPTGTKMFQFPALALLLLVRVAVLQTARLSHSEIFGSRVICTYPKLIAAYHVLHRLREPRHPPYALSYFLYDCICYQFNLTANK